MYPGYPGGYPQPGYSQPGYPAAGGYPGAPSAAPVPGYPGAAPPGYPGAAPPGYPGAAGGGYPSASPAGAPPAWIQQYGPPAPSGAPGSSEGAIEALQQWFFSVDKDRSGQITAVELAEFRGTFLPTNLGLDLADKLVRVFDKDRTNAVEFNEFVLLFRFLEAMHKAFVDADRDRSQTLEAGEIHQAFQNSGFTMLDRKAIDALFRKYDLQRVGSVSLNGFLAMAADVAIIRTKFEAFAKGQPQVSLGLSQIIEIIS